MDTHIYTLGVRVLLYKEEDEVCAHALELDLVGYGKTEKSAICSLQESITAQISFARHKNDDHLLPFRAPQDFFDRWEKAHEAALRKEILGEKSASIEIKAVCININTRKKLTKPSSARFTALDLACA